MAKTTSKTATISISHDGVWATSGRVVDGRIVDAPGMLGDDQDASDATYEAIEDQIADGLTDGEVDRPDGTYTWWI